MPRFKQEVIELRAFRCMYTVQAADIDEAKNKIATGETVEEEELKDDGVQQREPWDEPSPAGPEKKYARKVELYRLLENNTWDTIILDLEYREGQDVDHLIAEEIKDLQKQAQHRKAILIGVYNNNVEEEEIPNEKLWLRLGDSGEYEEFGDDMTPIMDVLKENGIKKDDVRQIKGGLEASGFTRDNYISLYWGDADANFVREISKTEFEAITSGL